MSLVRSMQILLGMLCARGQVQHIMQAGTVASALLQQEVNPFRRVYVLADAVRWCTDVLQALVLLHTAETPMVHRDLKLENVLLTKRDGVLRAALTDFGLTGVRVASRSESATPLPCL